MHYRRVIFRGWSCIWFLWLSGCASVPKETVALSMAVGEDIQQLYSGYKNVVRFSFEQMRRNGLVVIDEVWTPAYLKSFVREGELLEIAREELGGSRGVGKSGDRGHRRQTIGVRSVREHQGDCAPRQDRRSFRPHHKC